MLNSYDTEGNVLFEFQPEIDQPKHVGLRDMYLFDIRSQFLEKLVKQGLSLNLDLDRLVRLLLPPQFRMDQYLLILLLGENMWKHILSIISLLRPFEGAAEQIFFTKNYRIEFGRGEFTRNSRAFIADIFERVEAALLPSRAAIERFKGVHMYSQLVSNIYSHLANLSQETTGGRVALRVKMSLWKDLCVMLTEINLDRAD